MPEVESVDSEGVGNSYMGRMAALRFERWDRLLDTGVGCYPDESL